MSTAREPQTLEQPQPGGDGSAASTLIPYEKRMNKLIEAIRHLENSEWEKAHVIVQDDDSTIASWLHGLVHVIEGDLENAKYWYRRAGRTFAEPFSLDNELAEAKQTLQAN